MACLRGPRNEDAHAGGKGSNVDVSTRDPTWSGCVPQPDPRGCVSQFDVPHRRLGRGGTGPVALNSANAHAVIAKWALATAPRPEPKAGSLLCREEGDSS